MHLSKAQAPSAPLGRERCYRSYEAFTCKVALILLAAIVNGSAWWLLSLLVCTFFGGLAGSTLPVAVG